MPVDTIETRQELRDGRSRTPNGRIDVAAFGPRPEPRPIVASPPQWHVLHTRARQEKALAKTLLAAGIEHYLPLVGRVSYRGRRKCIVQQPLFASFDQVAASRAIASHASVQLLSAVRDFISDDAQPSRASGGVQSHPFPAVEEELAHAKAA